MKCKSLWLYTLVAIATLAMLLPVIHFVNPTSKNQSPAQPATYRADGAPFPPLPPGVAEGYLIADGAPFPPLPPKAASLELVADGAPFPPLPPGVRSSELVADGAPFPPLPPGLAEGYLIADGAPFPPLPPKSVGVSLGA